MALLADELRIVQHARQQGSVVYVMGRTHARLLRRRASHRCCSCRGATCWSCPSRRGLLCCSMVAWRFKELAFGTRRPAVAVQGLIAVAVCGPFKTCTGYVQSVSLPVSLLDSLQQGCWLRDC